jgi:hypothetical protein
VSSNGKRASSRARIEIVSPVASDTEAAAVVAAVEQFLADTAPPTAEAKASTSGWQAAALREGIAARQIGAGVWGAAPSWRDWRET